MTEEYDGSTDQLKDKWRDFGEEVGDLGDDLDVYSELEWLQRAIEINKIMNEMILETMKLMED